MRLDAQLLKIIDNFFPVMDIIIESYTNMYLLLTVKNGSYLLTSIIM